MFSLIDYKPEHAVELMRGGANEPNLVPNEKNIKYAHDVITKGPCGTGLFDDEIVSCGGIWKIWEGRGEAWFLCKKDIGNYHINPATAKDWLHEKFAECKLNRLETMLDPDFPKGILYAEWLGFEFESRKVKFYADGSDALEYVIIKGD